MAKRKRYNRRACKCRRFYVYDDEVLCLHRLFRRNIPEALVKSGYGRMTKFELYYDYNPRYKYQTGARVVLSKATEVITAIELAKRHKVEMITVQT